MIDNRLVKVSIDIDGVTHSFTDLYISATGTKYANYNQNECEVTIANVDKPTRDYLLTETSQFNLNRKPKVLKLEAGRESYGLSLIYSGNIVASRVTQPPDIKVILKCMTGNWYKTILKSQMSAGRVDLKTIAHGIAQDINAKLDFQATNRTVTNYSYTGNALGQVGALSALGNISAYVDNDTLIVKNGFAALSGEAKVIDAENGMVGIPDITERGLRVKYFLDNKSRVGGLLKVNSKLYPAVNGNYITYKLGFEIANREQPFYYIAEAQRIL